MAEITAGHPACHLETDEKVGGFFGFGGKYVPSEQNIADYVDCHQRRLGAQIQTLSIETDRLQHEVLTTREHVDTTQDLAPDPDLNALAISTCETHTPDTLDPSTVERNGIIGKNKILTCTYQDAEKDYFHSSVHAYMPASQAQDGTAKYVRVYGSAVPTKEYMDRRDQFKQTLKEEALAMCRNHYGAQADTYAAIGDGMMLCVKRPTDPTDPTDVIKTSLWVFGTDREVPAGTSRFGMIHEYTD